MELEEYTFIESRGRWTTAIIL